MTVTAPNRASVPAEAPSCRWNKKRKAKDNKIKSTLKAESSKIDKNLRRIRSFLINETISEDEYRQEKKNLLERKSKIQSELEKLNENSEGLLQPFKKSVSFLKLVKKKYYKSEDGAKRLILRILSDKMTIKNRKVHFSARFSGFSLKKTAGGCRNSVMYTLINDVKTLHEDIKRLKGA